MQTAFTTATLVYYGFSLYADMEQIRMYLREKFYREMPEDFPLEKMLPQHQAWAKQVYHPIKPEDKFHPVCTLINGIKSRKGVWLFVSINDFDDVWQKFLKDMNWESRVMFRSVPTRNYNYDTPSRLMTLYIMDFRNVE